MDVKQVYNWFKNANDDEVFGVLLFIFKDKARLVDNELVIQSEIKTTKSIYNSCMDVVLAFEEEERLKEQNLTFHEMLSQLKNELL